MSTTVTESTSMKHRDQPTHAAILKQICNEHGLEEDQFTKEGKGGHEPTRRAYEEVASLEIHGEIRREQVPSPAAELMLNLMRGVLDRNCSVSLRISDRCFGLAGADAVHLKNHLVQAHVTQTLPRLQFRTRMPSEKDIACIREFVSNPRDFILLFVGQLPRDITAAELCAVMNHCVPDSTVFVDDGMTSAPHKARLHMMWAVVRIEKAEALIAAIHLRLIFAEVSVLMLDSDASTPDGYADVARGLTTRDAYLAHCVKIRHGRELLRQYGLSDQSTVKRGAWPVTVEQPKVKSVDQLINAALLVLERCEQRYCDCNECIAYGNVPRLHCPMRNPLVRALLRL